MTTRLATRCRAKINLTLRVLGRRADGYHELESLVAFAADGDLLTLEPADETSLTVAGPFGEGLATEPDNLVLKATRALSARVEELRGGRFHLVKRLPLASGIGGGSADAAGALRLLAQINGLAPDDARLIEAAQETGSDVPVCLKSRPRVMCGTGERLGEILDLPPLFAVLANPGVAVETRNVFAALALAPGESALGQGAPTPAATLDGIVSGTNDLAHPARHVAPIIGDVLDALGAQPGCRLARMSGSGATCFAIFDDCRTSAAAAKAIATEHPGWWVRPTQLG